MKAMAYNESIRVDETEGVGFDSILKLFRILISKLWVIIVLVVLFGVAGYGFSVFTYSESYTSRTVINAMNKTKDASGVYNTVSSASDMQAAATLANNLRYLLKNSYDLFSLVQQQVALNTGETYDVKKLMSMVSVNVVTDTTYVEVNVVAPSADASYEICSAIATVYKQITDQALPTASFEIADNATVPTAPNSNMSGILYTFAGMLVGGMVAVTIILISNRINNLVLTSDDIRKKFNINVVASVLRLNQKKKKGEVSKGLLITDKTVGLPFIETFKLLRTKIENVYLKKGYKVFAVTSSTENEGKTTVSVNTALSLAKSGKSVLLIDADIRKPSVYKSLGVPVGGDKGVYDVVSGKKSFEESIKYVERYNLYLLVNGTPIADPSEVLASKAMADIVAEAKKNFDFVIIDCAPAGIVADATIIANYSDSVLFVVSEGKPSMRQVEYAISDLSTTKADIFGCVYNNAANSLLGLSGEKGSGYFSRSYGYSKSYGSGYGDTNQKKRK